MSFGLRDLGQNIKRLRLKRESRIKPGKPMLQRELAGLAEIPASSLCNIENGKYRNPTWEILGKIAQGLEVEIPDLFISPEDEVSPSQIALTEMIEMLIRDRLESMLSERQKK
jgi:transcriptional regulator with XRE-family HTH domain